MLLNDDHITSPLHQWHAVLELKQRDRGAPTPPSTGGDWELLSPAKAGSACGSIAHSDNDDGAAMDEAAEAAAPIDVMDTTALLLTPADLDAEPLLDASAAGKTKAAATMDEGLTHLGITWLVSWFSPGVACPSVAELNDYVQQVSVGGHNIWWW